MEFVQNKQSLFAQKELNALFQTVLGHPVIQDALVEQDFTARPLSSEDVLCNDSDETVLFFGTIDLARIPSLKKIIDKDRRLESAVRLFGAESGIALRLYSEASGDVTARFYLLPASRSPHDAAGGLSLLADVFPSISWAGIPKAESLQQDVAHALHTLDSPSHIATYSLLGRNLTSFSEEDMDALAGMISQVCGRSVGDVRIPMQGCGIMNGCIAHNISEPVLLAQVCVNTGIFQLRRDSGRIDVYGRWDSALQRVEVSAHLVSPNGEMRTVARIQQSRNPLQLDKTILPQLRQAMEQVKKENNFRRLQARGARSTMKTPSLPLQSSSVLSSHQGIVAFNQTQDAVPCGRHLLARPCATAQPVYRDDRQGILSSRKQPVGAFRARSARDEAGRGFLQSIRRHAASLLDPLIGMMMRKISSGAHPLPEKIPRQGEKTVIDGASDSPHLLRAVIPEHGPTGETSSFSPNVPCTVVRRKEAPHVPRGRMSKEAFPRGNALGIPAGDSVDAQGTIRDDDSLGMCM